MLQNSRNFLLMVGSNDCIDIDGSKTYNFGDYGTMTLDEFLANGESGDSMLNSYLLGSVDINLLKTIQQALSDASAADLAGGGSVDVKDTLFYRSGISSIAVDSYFNGPFLYNASPSMLMLIMNIRDFIELYLGESGDSNTGSTSISIPMIPSNVSGVSKPVQVNVSGKSEFYDYKTIDEMDFTGLIKENLSTFIGEIRKMLASYQNNDKAQALLQALKEEWSIDDIFPMKTMLFETAQKQGFAYSGADDTYVNTPVAYYGGSVNRSTVTFEGMNSAEHLTSQIEVDWVKQYMTSSAGDMSGFVQSAMQKAVTVVAGFEPFKFVCAKGDGYLFGQAPSVSTLRNNLKR
jgi:hypothetical protein